MKGNLVGVDATGMMALGNGGVGVDITDAARNTIGGRSAAARNVISGNSDGVSIRGTISGTTMGNIVQGNYIGTDKTGAGALGNHGMGILVSTASNNRIGGSRSGSGNVISANGFWGVYLGEATGTVVQGNYIGTDSSGTRPLGNHGPGVELNNGAENNTIGGTKAGAGNVISANDATGIELIRANENLIQGNFIGTDVTGKNPLGNADLAIQVLGSGNQIGGAQPGAGNVIAFNAYGISIVEGQRNSILGNSIFSNSFGIDLEHLGRDAVTPNDPGDSDTGPNELQNFPEIQAAAAAGGTRVTGNMPGAPNGVYRLEFFANSSCTVWGFGEGAEFLGFISVQTDANGDAAVDLVLPAVVPAGQFVTATATDADGNTSEFSHCAELRRAR